MNFTMDVVENGRNGLAGAPTSMGVSYASHVSSGTQVVHQQQAIITAQHVSNATHQQHSHQQQVQLQRIAVHQHQHPAQHVVTVQESPSILSVHQHHQSNHHQHHEQNTLDHPSELAVQDISKEEPQEYTPPRVDSVATIVSQSDGRDKHGDESGLDVNLKVEVRGTIPGITPNTIEKEPYFYEFNSVQEMVQFFSRSAIAQPIDALNFISPELMRSINPELVRNHFLYVPSSAEGGSKASNNNSFTVMAGTQAMTVNNSTNNSATIQLPVSSSGGGKHTIKQERKRGELPPGTIIHRPPPPDPNAANVFACWICGLDLQKSLSFEEHMAEVHNVEKPYRCDGCGVTFKRKAHLDRHRRIHLPTRPYQCGICGKGFTRNEHVRRHSYTHSGKKPFCCPYCSHQFIRKEHTLKHMKVCSKRTRLELSEEAMHQLVAGGYDSSGSSPENVLDDDYRDVQHHFDATGNYILPNHPGHDLNVSLNPNLNVYLGGQAPTDGTQFVDTLKDHQTSTGSVGHVTNTALTDSLTPKTPSKPSNMPPVTIFKSQNSAQDSMELLDANQVANAFHSGNLSLGSSSNQLTDFVNFKKLSSDVSVSLLNSANNLSGKNDHQEIDNKAEQFRVLYEQQLKEKQEELNDKVEQQMKAQHEQQRQVQQMKAQHELQRQTQQMKAQHEQQRQAQLEQQMKAQHDQQMKAQHDQQMKAQHEQHMKAQHDHQMKAEKKLVANNLLQMSMEQKMSRGDEKATSSEGSGSLQLLPHQEQMLLTSGVNELLTQMELQSYQESLRLEKGGIVPVLLQASDSGSRVVVPPGTTILNSPIVQQSSNNNNGNSVETIFVNGSSHSPQSSNNHIESSQQTTVSLVSSSSSQMHHQHQVSVAPSSTSNHVISDQHSVTHAHKKSKNNEDPEKAARPYICEVCQKAFIRNEHLRRHVLTHSGEKPFSCNICNKAFSRREHLTKHARSHHKNSEMVNSVSNGEMSTIHQQVVGNQEASQQHQNIQHSSGQQGAPTTIHLVGTVTSEGTLVTGNGPTTNGSGQHIQHHQSSAGNHNNAVLAATPGTILSVSSGNGLSHQATIVAQSGSLLNHGAVAQLSNGVPTVVYGMIAEVV